MFIHKAYRYELDPTNIQKTHLRQHAGTARFTYNWGLEQRIQGYQRNVGNARYTSATEQHKTLNSLKKTRFPWMYNISKCAPPRGIEGPPSGLLQLLPTTQKRRTETGVPPIQTKRGEGQFPTHRHHPRIRTHRPTPQTRYDPTQRKTRPLLYGADLVSNRHTES